MTKYQNRRWTFYILLIWTMLSLVSLILVPETFHPVLLARKAASLRKRTNNDNYYSASERANASKSIARTIQYSLYRPFQLLFLEPMCLCLCIYSALLLGILYLFFGAFPLVFRVNHGFELWQTGLTFLGLMVGMLIGLSSSPIWHRNHLRLVEQARMNSKADQLTPDPEFRLPPAIAGALCIPIGIFVSLLLLWTTIWYECTTTSNYFLQWFGWTTYSSIHWIVPIIGSTFFGIGLVFHHSFPCETCTDEESFFLVFSCIFTFLVDAYPIYTASALAANTFTRCLFAAAFPLFGEQSTALSRVLQSTELTSSVYNKLDFQWASTLLAMLTCGHDAISVGV